MHKGKLWKCILFIDINVGKHQLILMLWLPILKLLRLFFMLWIYEQKQNISNLLWKIFIVTAGSACYFRCRWQTWVYIIGSTCFFTYRWQNMGLYSRVYMLLHISLTKHGFILTTSESLTVPPMQQSRTKNHRMGHQSNKMNPT